MLPIIDTLFPLGNFFVVKAEHVGVGNVSLEAVLHASELELAKKASKEYVDEQIAAIPRITKTSQLQNDSGFLTQHQDLSAYAKKSDIPSVPTKTSQLQNDSGFLTQHQSLADYVKNTDARLSNARPASDVPAWAKASNKPSYTKAEIGLSNVDNTSDVDKPISTATQMALNDKADTSTVSALSEAITANTTKTVDLQSQIDNLVVSGGGDSNPEVVQARTDTNGVTHATLKTRIDNEVTGLKNDVSLVSAVYPFAHGNKTFVKWEQGRYNATQGSKATKNDTDADNIKAIRIRTDMFSLDYSVRMDVATGYSAQVYKMDESDIIVKYINWTSSEVIDSSLYSKFAVVVKNDTGAEIPYTSANDIVSFTMLSDKASKELIAKDTNLAVKNSDKVLISGIKYAFGNVVASTYDATIAFGDSKDASHIRIRSNVINVGDVAVAIEADEGYIAKIVLCDSNLRYKGDVTTSSGFVSTKYGFVIAVQKSDNSEITEADAYAHVRVYRTNYKTFTFEAGSGAYDSGVYKQNNDPAVATMRVRTNIQKVNTPCRITMKNGYKINVVECHADGTVISELTQKTTSGSTIWMDDICLNADKYYGLIIKPVDSTVKVYPMRVNLYADFNYNYASENIGDVASRFNGMKILYVGDSITEKNYTASSNWTQLLDVWFGFDSNNIATGGSGIVRGNANAWNTKIENVTGDYDLILVMGNMNDYSGNVFNESKLGQFGDKGLNTQYGAVNTFLKKILDKWPLAKVGWITSTPRQYLSGDPDNPDPVVSDGYLWSKTGVFENADKAIMEVCHNYSVPVLDLFHESNLQAWSTAQRSEYFYADGNSVHPNNKGHMIMAAKIADFVKRNF